jgi:CheY-like chemotaxis protein
MRAATNTDRRGLQILLVEDHADTARALSKLLARRGYVVCVAESLGEARRSARESTIDLLICDLALPDGSGLELMGELRDRAGLRGICTSGSGSEEDVRRCKAAGFAAHVIKPIDLPRLESLIEQLAESRDE